MKKWKPLLAKIILALVVFGLGWTGYIQWLIQSSVSNNEFESKDAGIVLGAALWDDRPSPALQERLDHAIGQYRQGKFGQFIVSGGTDRNGATISEAEGMARYLAAQGIPEADILLETKSVSTYENLLFSRDVMDRNGLKSAVIITHTYHGARALDMAEFIGYENAAVSLTDSQVMWMPWHKTRETLAYTKWLLDKWRMKIMGRNGQ